MRLKEFLFGKEIEGKIISIDSATLDDDALININDKDGVNHKLAMSLEYPFGLLKSGNRIVARTFGLLYLLKNGLPPATQWDRTYPRLVSYKLKDS